MAKRSMTVGVLLLLTCFLTSSHAQEAKKQLQAKDYGEWESLRSPGVLSSDGQWIAYTISRVNGENELRLKKLGSDKHEAFEYGTRPTFSDNNMWLGYLVGLSEKEREKLKKSKKPARNSFALRRLADGETTEIEDVASFTFDEDGGFLSYTRYKAKGAKGGADLVVRNLETGDEMCFGNVSAHTWCEEAPLVAMTIDTADNVGNSVVVYNAETRTLQALDCKKADYGSMRWREDAADLAFLRETEHDDKEDEEPTQVVITWTGLDTPKAEKTVFDHRKDKSFPEKMRIVTSGGLRWRKSGGAVYFAIREWEKIPEDKQDEKKDDAKDKLPTSRKSDDTDKGDKEKAKSPTTKKSKKDGKGKKAKKKPEALKDSLDEHAGVDVWHAKDTRIIPHQKKAAGRDRTKSHLCALWLDGKKFIRIADDVADASIVLESGNHAVARDSDKYEKIAMFGPNLVDAYIVDVRTGERHMFLEKHKYVFGGNPEGSCVLYIKNNTWWKYDVEKRSHTKIDIPVDMINDEGGQLTDEHRPYGTGGWSKDSKFVYLYDKFDIWRVAATDASATRLTQGREQGLRFRLLDLDPDEDHIDATKPLYLSVYGEYSKMSGYALLKPSGDVETLVLKDKRIAGLRKADDADVFVYTEQSFDDSPDTFVSGPSLKDAKQVTKTNPQQENYFWGRGELINYTNANGEKLQGALHYPAGYSKGKKYPMIVYIYEKRSQNLHSYISPSERSPYNPAVLTTQGYFVYQPDIVYRPQNPGISAIECVVPAVKSLFDRGDIDEKKVGLVGHSWGAYQTAFIVSRSDVFAAGVAGAPLTNMMSMSTNIYWNSGRTNASIFHESQGRMDRPFWQDVETYIKNSPIFGMDSLNTPLLIAFGDKDGAVDWHQGIEMYNAARLAEKQLVMLVYAGENHGLRKKPNQVDYHWRIREWFGHYLKGEKAPEWIKKGTSFLDREKEIKELDSAKKKGKSGPGKKSK